jgi:hypothetical protein
MSNGYVSHTGRNNHSLFAAILQRCAWLLIDGLFVAAAGAGVASTVPFSDGFSYADGSDLDGSNGWGVVSSGGSVIATNSSAQLIDATTPAVVDDSNIGTRNALAHRSDVNPDWKVDGDEINTVLSYWRTVTGYHIDTNSVDGFARGEP